MIYCYHCMSKIENDNAVFCPECGKKCSSHYPKSDELPPGTVLSNGRYLVGVSIGSGGFGITYIGRDLTLNKRIVIKETFYNGLFSRNTYDKSQSNPLSVSYSGISFEKVTQKAKKECETLASAEGLDNIVKVYDYFFENNTSYIITEFIEGETLYSHVKRFGRYTWDELYSKMKPLIYSLAELHSMDILHRDIKPENIMIKENKNLGDRFVLIDFGLARSNSVQATMSTGMSFTPGYSPFEQRTFQGKEGEFIDVYALAATIYFALTGEVPEMAVSNDLSLNFPRINELTSAYNVPPHVVIALKNALRQNYMERTQSLKIFLSEIENRSVNIQKQEPNIQTSPPSGISQKTIAATMTSNQMFAGSSTMPPQKSGSNPVTYSGGYQQPMQQPINQAQNAAWSSGMPYGQMTQNTQTDVIPAGGKGINKAAVIVSSLLTFALILSFVGIAIFMKSEKPVGNDTDDTKSSVSRDIDGNGSRDLTVESVGQFDNITDPDAVIDIDVGSGHTIGLKKDGTVVACGLNDYNQCNVTGWTDITAVKAGAYHSVGLKSDGTLIAIGDNEYGQCNVSDWTDIVAVSADSNQTVGLKSDGTVVAVGDNEDGQCNVSGWYDIVAVSTGYRHTVGLKSDGTVVACGWNKYGQCDISDWEDITAISAGNVHTLGLKSDGTVVAVGKNEEKECDVSEWTDIKAISAGYAFSAGIKTDGTTVAAVDDEADEFGQSDLLYWTDIAVLVAGNGHSVGIKNDGTAVAVGLKDFGQCDVTNWETITYLSDTKNTDNDNDSDSYTRSSTISSDGPLISLSAGHSHSLGLKSDGTAVACGYNEMNQCDVEDWEDLVAVAAGTWHSVGLKSNGTVVAVGSNNDNECDVSNWKDVEKISAGTYHTIGLKKDGTVLKAGLKYGNLDDVTKWTNIVDISSGGFHTVGLKKDGTVVAAGRNDDGECNVSSWTDIVAVSAGDGFTVGLKSNGTVVAVGNNDRGQCNVSSWSGITAVSAGYLHTIGLKKDGTAAAVGWDNFDRCKVSDWKDIVLISAGDTHSLGLTKDGTAVAVGNNLLGACDISEWNK